MWLTTRSLSIEKPSVDHPLLCEISKKSVFFSENRGESDRSRVNEPRDRRFSTGFRDRPIDRDCFPRTEQVTRRKTRQGGARGRASMHLRQWERLIVSKNQRCLETVARYRLRSISWSSPRWKEPAWSPSSSLLLLLLWSHPTCCVVRNTSRPRPSARLWYYTVIEKSPCDPPRFTSMYSVSPTLHVCSYYRKRQLRRN